MKKAQLLPIGGITDTANDSGWRLFGHMNMPTRQPRIVDAAWHLPLADTDRCWLEATSRRFYGRYPNLEEIWQLMDEVWDDLRCDTESLDQRVTSFYQHPVWLLNGLFIEQHELSLENRRDFTAWVAAQNPRRVADYGGGFGTLGRMIGAACPRAAVDIIEPHPHPAAIERAAEAENVRYHAELTGEYDVLIATDVFEHVSDPLALVVATARHLRPGGRYLLANCFWPVIKCHLPQTFHFRHSWDAALAAMGLLPSERVCYGRAVDRQGDLVMKAARLVEKRSRWVFPWIDRLPEPIRRRIVRMVWKA